MNLDISLKLNNNIKASNGEEGEDRYKMIFEEAPIGIGVFNSHSSFLFQLNNKFGEILGRSVEEMKTLDWKSYSHCEELEENIEQLNLLRKKIIVNSCMYKRFYKPDGTVVWVNLTIAPFKTESICNLHLCIIEDITDKIKKDEETKHLSLHDVLTNVYNRMFFEEEKRRLGTSRRLPLSVIMGDVNGLKMTNDLLGHNVGDELLREIGTILNDTCRDEDIIARIGGDEFVILLPETDEIGAANLCKRIKNSCKKYERNADKGNFYLSISLGHATKTSGDQSIDNLMLDAERMLYKSKNLERRQTRRTIMKMLKNQLITMNYGGQEQYNYCVKLTEKLGVILNLSPYKLKKLLLLQEFHDIGKLRIDESQPSKNFEGQKDLEIEEYQRHTEYGYKIALAIPEIKGIADEIRYHHENWDGSGYPKGLMGDKIPLLSRIIRIVDAYFELSCGSRDENQEDCKYAEKYFLNEAGRTFDPMIVKEFLMLIC